MGEIFFQCLYKTGDWILTNNRQHNVADWEYKKIVANWEDNYILRDILPADTIFFAGYLRVCCKIYAELVRVNICESD